MSEHKLNAGDVVVLKSGGPNMTVDRVEYHGVLIPFCHCVWFDKNHICHRKDFDVASVEVVNG